MTPKLISAADAENRAPSTAATPMRVVIVTLDKHLAGATERVGAALAAELPGVTVSLHAASDWASDEDALARCKAAIADAHIIIASMLFMDEHVRAIGPALEARRDDVDAMMAIMSAGEIVKLTRAGQLDMSAPAKGLTGLIKRLRGKGKSSGSKPAGSEGAKQMAILRNVSKVLKFIPGAAQDLRAYFLTLQYWLAGSDENVAAMVRFLVGRYAAGPRQVLRGAIAGDAPRVYPEVGLYHPRSPERILESVSDLPAPVTSDIVVPMKAPAGSAGTVGVLVMRSYVLAGDSGHYDGAIAALEAQGLTVIPAFASGLDARPAIEKFFVKDGVPVVDAVVSLTGFSLVGGPAYNDASGAEAALKALDVPYICAHPLEFQTLQQWGGSSQGLSPVESTIMVAIPELDGAIAPTVFGGRGDPGGEACEGCGRACDFPDTGAQQPMRACPERVETLAARVARLVALRRAPRDERRVAVVIFNFPPNGGGVGTAAYLDVFASLHNTLTALREAGYALDVPGTPDALRAAVVQGNAELFGADANVYARIPAEDHVRRERWLADLEAQWGPAPGRQLSDGANIQILGARFGNVFVGIQPGFGYEGDPMRLLFEEGFAPTHAFSAFYRYLREDFGAHAVLHFGTHGALEFMPGKQAGLAERCWPERLIGDLPNFYLYAANNPSEGMIAKRRAAATLVSHLTPPVEQAGLYKGLEDLKASLTRRRGLPPGRDAEAQDLAELIQAQAAELDLVDAEPQWTDADADARVAALSDTVRELEETLIPHGLHVVGQAAPEDERAELLTAMGEAMSGARPEAAVVAAAMSGVIPESLSDADRDLAQRLATAARHLVEDHEIPAILHALDGGYIAPVAGGDILRAPEILPTGRNLHGFDPFRMPSAFAVKDGARQAQRLLDRHVADGNALPETVALVLWGTDNLKSEGGPIAQALALMGARPRFDGYGRLCGAELISLEDLGRPRVDVMATLSGIFRDLLPMHTKLLAEAAWLAASAEDEPAELNFVRKHALATMAETGCDLETAALRVFSNADGAYGANVNQLIDSGAWGEEDELADAFEKRKSYAYGRDAKPVRQEAILRSVLRDVDLAYQNLDSVELGVTTIDHYFDTLGGVGRAANRAKREAGAVGADAEAAVYIGDQTRGEGKVRTLSEQVALETRTRMLNPRWYDALLKHGYEGVRQIEAHVTNTMGWSATTGRVSPWVYQRLAETFVLDETLREKLASLNPRSAAKTAQRLIEACERNYWTPDPATLEALRAAGADLEDRVEGVAAA